MLPKSLSPTSAQVYEACPSRWRVEFLEKAPQPPGDAAGMGTVDHAVLQRWVEEGWYQRSGFDREAEVARIYEEEYRKVFAHDEKYGEGLELALRWLARQDWTNRVVLCTEKKRSFEVPTSVGPIPFNYIMDRMDLLEGPHQASGHMEIEVVDYKTIGQPLQPEQLKLRLQARCYALAAQLEYPDADRIWVTFDLLRYEPVGCVFTKQDNRETWRYLVALAERIIADDGTAERLNPDCRYCIRKHECGTLNRHVLAGGVLGITDPADAADRRAKLDYAKKAIEKMIAELDPVILTYCENESVDGFATDETVVTLTASKRRDVDPVLASRVIGSDLLVEHGAKLPMKAVDELLKKKSSTLTDEQKSRLRRLIRTNYGDLRVETKPVNPLDEP